MIQKTLREFFYGLILGTLFCFSLSRGIITTTVLEISPLETLLWSFGFVLIFCLIFQSRISALIALASFFTFGMCAFLLHRLDSLPLWLTESWEAALLLFFFLTDQIPFFPELSMPLSLFIIGSLALYGVIFLYLWFNFYLLILLGIALLAIPSLLGFPPPPGPALLFVLCGLILLTGELGRKRLIFLPICLLLFLTAYFLPRPYGFEPAALSAGRNFFEVVRITGGESEGIRRDLGGPVILEEREIMRVFTGGGRPYLRGQIYLRYTGHSWEGSVSKDVTQMTGQVDISDESWAAGFSQVQIFPKTAGQRIYTPPGAVALRMDGEAYTVIYRPLDSDWQVAERTPPFSPYLQLPDTLPPRVFELARTISAEAQSPRGQLEAIVRYLSQFPYTLAADSLPAGADFVDFFLFSAQAGYCTSFATATVVLARALGIPARYVEGYILPAEPDEDGGYTITGAQAHAWAEIYAEGVGWVVVEATPPYVPEGAWEMDLALEAWASWPEEEVGFDGMAEAPERDWRNAEIGRRILWPMFILGAVLALVGGAFFYHMRFPLCRIALWWAGRRLDREAVLAYFHQIIRAFKNRGLPIRPGETALQYAERLERGGFLEAAELFSQAAYGGQIQREDRRKMAALSVKIGKHLPRR